MDISSIVPVIASVAICTEPIASHEKSELDIYTCHFFIIADTTLSYIPIHILPIRILPIHRPKTHIPAKIEINYIRQ
jgi:hypothetical protein